MRNLLNNTTKEQREKFNAQRLLFWQENRQTIEKFRNANKPNFKKY